MLGWAWEWLWWLAWYALAVGGWACWFSAHRRAERQGRELTLMASSLRYYASQRETSPHG